VQGFRVGDEVYYAGDITRSGSNSELQAVDERIVGHKPKKLTFAEAAAIPLTALTAHEALFKQLGIHKGSSLLVIGGAGGVGSIAIQMAKNAGARVFATASRPETQAWVRERGADGVLDHTQPLLPQLEALGLKGVEAIFNLANTALYWKQMAELILPFGKICSIVESPEPVDISLLMQKSATFTWEMMFTRSLFQTADMAEQQAILQSVAADLDAGRLKTTVTEVLEPIQAKTLREGHVLMESGKALGKIVLSGW
jgi:zinc-binding alcohol dehydrogenase family protein